MKNKPPCQNGITVIYYDLESSLRFQWDDKKQAKVLRERGVDFHRVIEIFAQSYRLSQQWDDPVQWMAIGWVDGRLITLIYEERRDKEGVYYWFVTAWRSTAIERRVYHEG